MLTGTDWSNKIMNTVFVYDIMSVDIISAPNVVSAHQRYEVPHITEACGLDIMCRGLGIQPVKAN